MSVVTLLFLAAFCAVDAFNAPLAMTTKRYDGYKVLSVVPTDRPTLDKLHNMMFNDIHVDFWKEPSRLGQKVTFMVPPEHINRIVTELRKSGAEFTIDTENMQDILTPMWNDIDRRRTLSPEPKAFDINNFNTLEDINAWLADLTTQCRVGLTCELYSIGNSYEGRPINVFKISKAGTGRKAYWIDGTIHAREWLGTSTVLNILNYLAKAGGDANALRLTDNYDWYILPVMNPDGYSYSWTNDRMWRKNRKPDAATGCYGVDLNRNFDFRWGNDGVSFDPCYETYCGTNGGSEPETVAVSAELVRVGPTLAAAVTVHTYGNMWMFPWGNTVDYAGKVCDFAVDNADLMLVADATANAIEAVYGTTWSRGNSCDVIYATTGGTDDYSKGVAGVKYAFCPELRGNSFIVDASEIRLSFNEVWAGLLAMVNTINA